MGGVGKRAWDGGERGRCDVAAGTRVVDPATVSVLVGGMEASGGAGDVGAKCGDAIEGAVARPTAAVLLERVGTGVCEGGSGEAAGCGGCKQADAS